MLTAVITCPDCGGPADRYLREAKRERYLADLHVP
jgi:hypothetical protein